MSKTAPTQAGRQIGYARVSTVRQDEAAQVAALQTAGCTSVYAERVSTGKAESKRPQLLACLAELQPGDCLTLAKLDRLGRTQVEVINRLAALQEQGIHVRTLDGLINTQALGKMAPLVVGLLTGLAEVERSLIRERTAESIAHRRATGGNLGGRPRSYRPERAALVADLRERGLSIREVAKATGLSRSAVGRICAAQEPPEQGAPSRSQRKEVAR
jgi:DNA invertase Pin-like site-specific DNA recombinase